MLPIHQWYDSRRPIITDRCKSVQLTVSDECSRDNLIRKNINRKCLLIITDSN